MINDARKHTTTYSSQWGVRKSHYDIWGLAHLSLFNECSKGFFGPKKRFRLFPGLQRVQKISYVVAVSFFWILGMLASWPEGLRQKTRAYMKFF